MKNQNNLMLLSRRVILCILLGGVFTSSCKKEIEKEEIKTQEISYSKETRFLAITLSTTEDKVIFDQKKKEFVINGWYHMSLKEVQELYSNANEYKLKYEK